MKDQPELENLFTEFQLLKQELDQLQQQTSLINQQLLEFKTIKSSLAEIKDTEKNTKLLIPLGFGVYVHALLDDNKSIMMNVGADTSVPKPISEAIPLIDKQVLELKGMLVELEMHMQQIISKLKISQGRIQELSSQKQ